MKKILLITIFLVMGCMQKQEISKTNQSHTVSEIHSAASETINLNTHKSWQYFENKDEMRNKTIYFAELYSQNEIDIGYPYGKVSLKIVIAASKPKDKSKVPVLNSYLILSDGMVDCSRVDGCEIHYRFDNKKVEDHSVFVLNNADSVLYLGNNGQDHELFSLFWVSKIMQAKNLIIEVPIVRYGSAQFKFDVSDLKKYEDYQNWAK